MTEKQFILFSIIILIIGIVGLFIMSQNEESYLTNKSSTNNPTYLPENKLLILEARVIEQTNSTQGTVLTLEINQNIKAFFDSKINQTLKGEKIIVEGFFKNNWLNIKTVKINKKII